jgi:hypothetical protein
MLKEQLSQIKNYHQEEIKKFVEEKIATEDLSIDKETKRNIEDENVMHFINIFFSFAFLHRFLLTVNCRSLFIILRCSSYWSIFITIIKIMFPVLNQTIQF